MFFPIADDSLKVSPIVHFTWFYKNNQTKVAQEMKFYHMICMLAAYKKIKPYKILCEIFDTASVRLTSGTVLPSWVVLEKYSVVTAHLNSMLSQEIMTNSHLMCTGWMLK